ncbi:MAG: GxxExxY protein [Flavobacteriales bacterium]|nr:GxxExxY protein [Flavobacteriales bacterium]
MTENELAKEVIGCAITVHRNLGPGLLENAYQQCLAYELRNHGLSVEVEKPMPLIYDEIKMDCGYRIDILVENKLILELKVVEELNDVHLAQTLTYLKLSRCKLGLLMNFDVAILKNGIKRVVNGL